MGWIYGPRPREGVDAYLRAEYRHDGREIIASGQKGSVWYGALSCPAKDGKPAFVLGIVVLIDYGGPTRTPFGAKHMDETFGPTASECPLDVLRVLSPLSILEKGLGSRPGYAADWRQRCVLALPGTAPRVPASAYAMAGESTR